MKQVLQHLRTGVTEVADVPCPRVQRGRLLICTSRTLVSAGTERMLVEFSKSSLIGKARSQPDRVRQVIDKVKTDGLAAAAGAVMDRLDRPLTLGYCNVGRVLEVGDGVSGYSVGDRVVSNGTHAEVVAVPGTLCCKVPDDVSDDHAAFTVVGAIGLQGVRLAGPTMGEAVAVIGLGLIGLTTVQLLRAQGCRVLAMDPDERKTSMARAFGAAVVDLASGEDAIAAGRRFSRGRGMDAVLITASTDSDEPVWQAARMCRKRGRIVLVGVTGLSLSRDDFYEKELTFQISCSYGPGRYDPAYEEHGADYPAGFVRWTAQRNFEAVLDMLSERKLDVAPLVSHRFSIAEADRAYAVLAGSPSSLGILLEYPGAGGSDRRRSATIASEATIPRQSSRQRPSLGVIGAGNYAGRVLIPAFKAAGAHLKVVSSNNGVTSTLAARKFGFDAATTDTGGILADPDVDALVIATRHDSHADLACAALVAGKHVFVEKPLATTREQLARIQELLDRRPGPLLTVGFNRRFAPHGRKMHELLQAVPEPKTFVMTVNAGAVPDEHWTQDLEIGGGRIVGEACHFVDLLRYLAGSSICGVDVTSTRTGLAAPADTVSLALRFQDGSHGVIHYLANGHRSFPKERLEVFVGGRVLQLDNFRRLTGFGWPGFKSLRLWRQDKGQRGCAAAFLDAIERNAPPPIPLDEILEVSRASIEIAEKVR